MVWQVSRYFVHILLRCKILYKHPGMELNCKSLVPFFDSVIKEQLKSEGAGITLLFIPSGSREMTLFAVGIALACSSREID